MVRHLLRRYDKDVGKIGWFIMVLPWERSTALFLERRRRYTSVPLHMPSHTLNWAGYAKHLIHYFKLPWWTYTILCIVPSVTDVMRDSQALVSPRGL
jgi:hypothetical protein